MVGSVVNDYYFYDNTLHVDRSYDRYDVRFRIEQERKELVGKKVRRKQEKLMFIEVLLEELISDKTRAHNK